MKSKLVPIACIFLALGCDLGPEQECYWVGESCDGNVLVKCRERERIFTEGPPILTADRSDCGNKFCIEAGEEAKCLTHGEPDPLCRDENAEYACDGNGIISCWNGYRTSSSARECEEGKYCIEGRNNCSISEGPDEHCASYADEHNLHSAWVYSTCAGPMSIHCISGHRIGEQDCGSEDLCKQISTGKTRCVMSPDIDPRCDRIHDGESYKQFHSLCDGNTVVSCVDSYVLSERDCGEKSCEEEPFEARCI